MSGKQIIDPGWAWDDKYNFAQAIKVGNLIFVSGQVALNSQGELVGRGDIKAQTRQVYENIKAILDKAGATFDNVIKANSYMTDIRQWPEMAEIRSQYLKGEFAGTGVQVTALAFEGLLLEVEVVAQVT